MVWLIVACNIIIIAVFIKISYDKDIELQDIREAYIGSSGKLICQLPGLTYIEYVRSLDNKRLVEVKYSTFFIEKSFRYGHIKNVPWDDWTIEEKMYLCAYGSSGNKLNKKDIEEIEKRYGVK